MSLFHFSLWPNKISYLSVSVLCLSACGRHLRWFHDLVTSVKINEMCEYLCGVLRIILVIFTEKGPSGKSSCFKAEFNSFSHHERVTI